MNPHENPPVRVKVSLSLKAVDKNGERWFDRRVTKSSNRVRRLASAQGESLSSNHSFRLISLPSDFHRGAHETRLRTSGIFLTALFPASVSDHIVVRVRGFREDLQIRITVTGRFGAIVRKDNIDRKRHAFHMATFRRAR
jgi:hypothetical protein